MSRPTSCHAQGPSEVSWPVGRYGSLLTNWFLKLWTITKARIEMIWSKTTTTGFVGVFLLLNGEPKAYYVFFPQPVLVLLGRLRQKPDWHLWKSFNDLNVSTTLNMRSNICVKKTIDDRHHISWYSISRNTSMPINLSQWPTKHLKVWSSLILKRLITSPAEQSWFSRQSAQRAPSLHRFCPPRKSRNFVLTFFKLTVVNTSLFITVSANLFSINHSLPMWQRESGTMLHLPATVYGLCLEMFL